MTERTAAADQNEQAQPESRQQPEWFDRAYARVEERKYKWIKKVADRRDEVKS